jgi:Zn-dependent hydrolases, including glyoxylases
MAKSSDYLQKSATHYVRQVHSTIWQITFLFPAPVNCWLLQNSDGLTLIDAAYPSSGQKILSAIECLDQPLRRIVITHAHPDHSGAAREVAEKSNAVVLAHTADLPYLQGQRSLAEEKGFWQSRIVLGAAQKLGLLDLPAIENVEAVADGDTIDNFKIIHTPGHTPGSISVWASDEAAIFSGDNLLYRMRMLQVGLPWFTVDLTTQRNSLHSYMELPARMIMGGHGPVFTGDIQGALKRLVR